MLYKRGFEFSFGWLFAIIVGAVILFLALYAASSIVKSERKIEESAAAKEFGILLTPIETNLESGKISLISFPETTRIFNGCASVGTFGEQKLSISIRSGIGQEWSEPGIESTFYNKYIFSHNVVEGRDFVVFSKPLSMPYKIADAQYLISAKDEYCFVQPPTYIRDELLSLRPKNINVSDDIRECKSNSRTVCFSSTGCSIDIDLQAQKVRKGRQVVYYDNAGDDYTLLYGAIFAEPSIYECQIKRIMSRASELAFLYRAKSEFLSPRGCSSGLEQQLLLYRNLTSALNSSAQLRTISSYAKELGRANELLSCKLF